MKSFLRISSPHRKDDSVDVVRAGGLIDVAGLLVEGAQHRDGASEVVGAARRGGAGQSRAGGQNGEDPHAVAEAHRSGHSGCLKDAGMMNSWPT